MSKSADHPDYYPAKPRSMVIAELLRVNHLLAEALLDILEEANSDMDRDIIITLAQDALANAHTTELA